MIVVTVYRKPSTSDGHNVFVRTPFWMFLDSMEIPLNPKSINIYLDEIGMILNSSFAYMVTIVIHAYNEI